MRFKRNLKGLSILEITLAIAMFALIGVAASNTIVFNFSANRRAEDNLQASLYLQEGIEAVRNIKKSEFTNMVNGTYGLSSTSGTWELSGSSDTFDKYSRQVIISDAHRDASGNLTSSGTVDPLTKRITVRVQWSFAPGQPKVLENHLYITNYERSIVAPGSAGMLVYADYSGSDDVIKYKLLNSDGTWSSAQSVPDINVPGNQNTRRVELYDSPTRNEKILVTKHSDDGQFMYAQVWDGESWGNLVLLAGYGDNTNPETRNFDGYYKGNGDFVVVYDDFTYSPKMRTWNGSNWSSQTSLPSVSAYPVWIVAGNQAGSNNAMVGVRESWITTKTSFNNGSSWSSVTTHGSIAPGFSIENISLSFSSTSPQVAGLMYNDGFDNTPNIRFWNGSSWGPSLENRNIGHTPGAMQLISRPTGNEFLGCVKDSNRDIHCIKAGHHSSWQNVTNGDVASQTDDGNQRSFSFEYERSGNLGIIVYSEGSSEGDRRIPKYRTYDPNSQAFSNQMNMTALGAGSSNALETVRTLQNPTNDNIMVVMGDTSQSVYTIQWDGDSNSFVSSGDLGLVRHDQYGSNDLDYWFDFKWTQYNGN